MVSVGCPCLTSGERTSIFVDWVKIKWLILRYRDVLLTQMLLYLSCMRFVVSCLFSNNRLGLRQYGVLQHWRNAKNLEQVLGSFHQAFGPQHPRSEPDDYKMWGELENAAAGRPTKQKYYDVDALMQRLIDAVDHWRKTRHLIWLQLPVHATYTLTLSIFIHQNGRPQRTHKNNKLSCRRDRATAVWIRFGQM